MSQNVCLASWKRAFAVDGRGDDRDENDVNHIQDPKNPAAPAPISRKRDLQLCMRMRLSRWYVGLGMSAWHLAAPS